jgi:hypothetical protein
MTGLDIFKVFGGMATATTTLLGFDTNEFLNIRGIWVLSGMLVASILFWIVNRKVLGMQAAASGNLARTLDRQIEALERERDDYRTKLHDERDSHQVAELRIKELESRPDLGALTALLTDQKEWMRALGQSLKDHSESDAAIFATISESLKSVLVEMKEINQRGMQLK